MPDIYWSDKPTPLRTVMITEDTAGNKWCAEFEGGTAPVRTWVERPHSPWDKKDSPAREFSSLPSLPPPVAGISTSHLPGGDPLTLGWPSRLR